MHGLDTSNVSSRVESSQVEFELIFVFSHRQEKAKLKGDGYEWESDSRQRTISDVHASNGATKQKEEKNENTK